MDEQVCVSRPDVLGAAIVTDGAPSRRRRSRWRGAPERKHLARCIALSLLFGCGATDISTAPTRELAVPPRHVSVVAPGSTRAGALGALPAHPVPLRIIDLGPDGPSACRAVEGQPPTACYLELTADGRVTDAFHATLGRVAADFTLTSRRGTTAFGVAPDGSLVGMGPNFEGSTSYEGTPFAQVLFCRLGAGPALECAHRFDPALVAQRAIWNAENCDASWTASVRGGEVLVRFSASPSEPPVVAARLEPAPADDDARVTALYLFALEAVEGETERHAPREPE